MLHEHQHVPVLIINYSLCINGAIMSIENCYLRYFVRKTEKRTKGTPLRKPLSTTK